MAKTTKDQPIAPTAIVPTVVQDTALSTNVMPDWMRGDSTGQEDIGREDVRLPRLVISQGLSPQMTPGGSDYLENLKLFEMFNDLTGEIYGKGPLEFIVVKKDKRHIEFAPRDEGGGVIDMDVPPGDERLNWTSDPDSGERKPPRATTFHEFVVLLLKQGGELEPIVLSIKDTNKWNRKAATRLGGFIKMGGGSIFSRIYTVQAVPEKNDQGTFGVYVIGQRSFVQNKAAYDYAKQFRQSIEGKTIVINREPGDDDIDNAGQSKEF